MYAVIVFALVLLSPMPFVSPFGHIVQDVVAQSPFGPFEPTTSPSLISGQNAQEFGLRFDFTHSPAGTFTIDTAYHLDISVIDNHTYALVGEYGTNVNIRNITNIESPTTVSTISDFGRSRLTSVVIDDSTYVLALKSGNLRIADISDVKNPVSSTYSFSQYALGVTTVLINKSTYALVGYSDGGILIVNITSPNNVHTVHNIQQGSEYPKIQRVYAITAITIGESVYALAANERYNGNFGLTIIDITDPSSPFLVSSETLGDRSYYMETVTIDESIYALVINKPARSVSIINVTDPYSPELASTPTHGNDGYTRLSAPNSITTTTFGELTFALVTDQGSTNGIQIIDITNPYAPSPVSALHDGENYHLDLATGISTVTLDGQTYALAASRGDDTVQIIKLDYQTVISLTSNNANPAYATEGDVLNLELGTTRTLIPTSSAEILGISAENPTISGENFAANITVGSEEIEKYANFTATLLDGVGPLFVTADDLSSNIFVDTKRPQISLIGDADLEVFPLTEESSIPGATATDGDPNYAGNYTITKNGNLSTTPLGSKVIFTYTAADDSVGNIGNSITRTVTVGQPNIIDFTSLNIASSSGDNFARAGESITVSIVTDGSELGNFTGNIFGKQFTNATNGGSANFTIVATPDDPYGDATFLITLTNASGNNITITNSLITDGSYITVDTVSPTIRLYDPDNVTAFTGSTAYVDPGAIAYDASYGEKTVYGTGTVNTLISGTYTLEYKAPDDDAGNTGQIVIRTVTVMPKPFEFIRSLNVYEGSSLNHTTVNDATFYNVAAMASIQINDSTYIMAATDRSSATGIGTHTVHIFDITNIDSPRLVNKTVFHDNNGVSFRIDHITISTIDGNTYAIASAIQHSTSSTPGVLIINISNPESPSLVTYVTNDQNFTGLYDPSRIAVTTIGEFTYALVPSSNPHGVVIMNITTPENPTLVIAIKDKESGGDYDILKGAEDIAIIHTNARVYALVTAIDDDGIQIIDITDISNPIPVSSIVDNRINSSSPYRALDSPRGIDTISIGESIYALVASYTDDGVQIINITNPENPSSASAYAGNEIIKGAYDVSTITIGESIYALSTAYEVDAIVLFDITNPAHPTFVHRLNDYSSSTAGRYHDLVSPEYITTVTLNTSTYALVSSLYGGIQVINLASPDVSVNSSNTNNASYAKTGDSLSIGLMTTDIIGSGSATILGLDADVSHVGENFTASIIVPSTIQEEYANFTVTLENNYGDIITLTQDDLAGSSVFVDNIAPKISLDGSDPYYLVQNRSIDTIPTVTVTDGDPNYPKKPENRYTIIPSNDLNTSKIGSTAIFTYTAKTDEAGNPGSSVTRNVTIVGYDPLNVTILTVSSDNSVNSNYARAGDKIEIKLKTDGNDANAINNIIGAESFEKEIFSNAGGNTVFLAKNITQSDTNGNLTFDIFVETSSGYAARVTQNDLTSSNIIIDTVYPVIYLYGVNNTVSNVGLPYVDLGAISYDLSYGIQNVTGTGTVNASAIGTYNILYDKSDFAGNPANITRIVHVKQLAPISLTNETSQFLVSPTTNVTDSADYPHLGDSYKVTTVEIDNSTYALIAAYADNGFTILDITTPKSPTLVFNATRNTRINADLNGPTGISTIQIQNSIYAVITSLNNHKIAILDITNPTLPIVKSIINNTSYPNIIKPSAVSTVDIDDSAYVLVVSKANSRIVIFNITEPTNLTQVAVLQDGADYTLGGVTHVTPIKMDGSTYILTAARGDNSVGIIDIGNPKMPKQVALLEDDGNLALNSVNSIEIISINGRTYALVASPGENAMQIIDVTHPTLPFPVSTARSGAEYPALLKPHDVTAIKVENSTYALLSAINTDSIQIIDITNPESPQPSSHISQGTKYTHLEKPQTLKAVQINDTAYALIAARDSDGIQIIQLEHEKTTQTPFSITSNSGINSLYAKAGDTVSIQITVNDTIDSSKSTVQILNLNTNVGTNGLNTINASVTIPTDSIEMNASITASITNYLGVTLDLTEHNLTGANVFVDTISPTIELIGDADYTVLVNTIFNDPNATASDGSPGYSASNYSKSETGILNTSILDSTVTYTYTADDDAAGNPGASTTRTVTVVDYTPLNVKSLTVSSNNSVNTGYAKAGDKIEITLKTDGNRTNAINFITGAESFDEEIYSNPQGNTVFLEKTITQSDTNGNLTFDILVATSLGYAARVTQNNLTSSNIIIDTISPIITLNGKNNTISILNHTYTDENATAYDLSYGSKNISPMGDVNITRIGNYTLTYSTTPDFAGNEAQNITRNVIVLDTPPIGIASLTIVTDDDTYAKAGDNLHLTLNVNDTISNYDAQILNADISRYSPGTTSLYMLAIVSSNAITESNAEFTITVTNINGTTLTVTEDDLTSPNVFIDTVSPRIQLVGHAEYFIVHGTENPIIPNAIATDGDPNYSGNYTLTTPDGLVNANINGSVYNYTYTADNDTAGNLGENVTRKVTVIDSEPITVTSLIATSSNSVNSNYAKVGDEIRLTLTADAPIEPVTGDILGDDNLAVSQSLGDVIIRKIITQSDTNGNLTFDIFVSNSSGYGARVTQNNLTTSNIIIDTVPPLLYLYGANNTISAIGSSYVDPGAISYDLSYGIKDVTSTDSVITSQVGTYHIEYDAPDFAGNPANIIRTVHVQKLPQLSLSSESSNLLITPESPIADPIQYPHLTDPFHIETVQIDGSTYALVASNHDGGFTILNMDNPELPSLVFNATSTQTNYSAIQGILGASPIQIQGKTYVVTISLSSKILIADITNPESPTFVSERSNGIDYPYLTNMTAISTFSIGDAAYAMIASQSGSWVSILNITEPANPTHLTVLENGANYDLNGPRHIAIIDADGSTFAVITSRTTGTVTILNMDNPEMPVQIHAIKDGIGLALSSATGIELVEINTRTYALVASNLDNAMQIIDITHPQLPFPVSTVQRSGTEYSGLNGPHYIAALQVEDATYAFVTSPSTKSIQVIDITNPSQPNPVTVLQNGTEYTHLVTPLYIESIQTNDDAYALVASRGSNGIQIINLGYEKTIQTPFSITSNNANSPYAKAGDTVSIQITINDTIDQSTSTVQILNLNTNVGASGSNTINASVTIPTEGIEMYANITASITNHLGAMLNLTENNLTGTNVFVDTISPTIELIGGADYTVLVNTTFIDPNATASDGSPGYSASNYSKSETGILNTSILDSTVTYTYTADDDAAGNPGASTTRTVTVVDYPTINVTNLTVSSNNSVNTGYAKAGDEITITLVTDGTDVESATGSILGDNILAQNSPTSTITFSKIITQGDTNGNLAFDILVINSTGYAASVSQNDLTSSNIIIDTISPTITLNGNNDTIIEFGSTYTDLGANAIDASYENTMTIYVNDVVDTFMIDTYTLVYTALDDSAGNLGPSITRIVTVSDSTPVMFISLSLNTSNNNPAYAKAGDIITVTLVANQTISSADTSIQNIDVTSTIQGNTLSANYTVQNSQQGNPTLEIIAYFDSSLPLTVTESNLTSTILIDTEKPKITLLGPSSITIPIDQSYVDDMADVSDNDPAYNGIVSSNASGVNTTKDDTYTIVYSANADNAGNIPDNATRIVTVSGFFLGISSNNTNYDNLAKEGDLVTVKIISAQYINASITSATILGRSADTNITGNTIYANTTVQSSDTNGNIEFSITVDPISGSLATFTHDDLTSANVIVDTIAPSVLSSTTVTPNLVTIAFNEPIINTASIIFRLTMTPTPTSVTIKNGSSIPYSVLEFVIPQRSSLSSDATVPIAIDTYPTSPTFTDFAGNALPAISLTTDDGITPSIQSATVISPTLIEVIFDENIKFAKGYTLVFPSPIVGGVYSGITENISANTLSIPSSTNPFQINTVLKVSIRGSSITDVAGNVLKPSSILTSVDSSPPYTTSKTMILVPYTTTLDPSTISTGDYRVTFGSNSPSTISTAQLSTDTATVILEMQIPFGTDGTPFVEQIGSITDIFGNAVTMQSAIAEDRTPPTLVSVISTSTSSITVTFSEQISAQSLTIGNYNLIGTTIRNVGSGTEDGSVIISTSAFPNAILQILNTSTIGDIDGNALQDGAIRTVIRIR